MKKIKNKIFNVKIIVAAIPSSITTCKLFFLQRQVFFTLKFYLKLNFFLFCTVTFLIYD